MPIILFKGVFYKPSNIDRSIIKNKPSKPTHTCRNLLVINIKIATFIENLTDESTR
jgi:hypothetical protein